jgi:hypothetical protein
MDRIPPMRVKWGLHPISAGGPKAETLGEASFRQIDLPARLPQKNLGLGLPPGRSKGRPGSVSRELSFLK